MKKAYKILLVLSGGTICTAVCDNEGQRTRSISEKSVARIKNNYMKSGSRFVDFVKIDESPNFGILSENMTIDKWNALIDYFRKNKNIPEYDGIVIAHGTDTLAYSASMFALVFKTLNIPVFLVSSHLPLEKADANGDENFRAAIALICRGIKPNVYVTYRNPSDNVMYLHLGSRLLQCANYSDDFYSRGAIALSDDYELQDEVLLPAEWLNSETKYDLIISCEGNWQLANCVLKISPYVGLDYTAFNLSHYKAILHGTYHSGTVCENMREYKTTGSSDSIFSLLDKAKGKCDIYVSPSDIKGEIYDSLAYLKKSGVHFVYGLTDEMLYCKLVIAYSIPEIKPLGINEFLNTNISGEKFIGWF